MTVALISRPPPMMAVLPYQLAVQALALCRSAVAVYDVRQDVPSVVYANAAFAALTGFPAGELLGRDGPLLHGPESDPQACAEIDRAIAGGNTVTMLLRSHRRDGSAFWNRLSLAPIRDEHGMVTHYAGTHEDVSEEVRESHDLQQVLLRQHHASLRLIEADLREALAQSRFQLLFQPQVHLANGSVVGFEALLRWQDPARGVILPTEFIPLAEACGMAGAITRWVIEQSVAQLRIWEDLGHRGLQVAINAPPSVFESDEVASHLLALLARHEIAGNQLEIELTERRLSDASPSVIERLRALRAHGISVAIDDFGTGSSNLSVLTRLPLDCLKLDMSFVHGAVSNPSDAMVARMTCELARALELRVVVEGIETAGQLQFFSKLQCDLAQGHFLAQPLEAADACALLQSGKSILQASAAPQRPRHLLLLDDEPNILRSLRRVFRAQPWEVHTANTPDEAFELLARHPIGVVMSDQRMPLMRGTDFLARVKQLHPDTVRIVLSGYTELQSVTEAINEGAIYKFLTKPWNDRQLGDEIEQAFHQHEMAAENQLLQQRLRDSNRVLEGRLRQNEQRLQHEEAALDVTHEALSVVPVPVLGIDASGMIAISNVAADRLLGDGASVVGEQASDVLPPELARILEQDIGDGAQAVCIGGARYEVRCSDLGAASRGIGTVITLLRGAAA